jgi:hypothetical protein
MKPKGKRAWLVTWEGKEAESLGRPKIVGVFQPRLSQRNITDMVAAMFFADYPFTLCEKVGFGTTRKKDLPRFLHEKRQNCGFYYGLFPKTYLYARPVKDLRCQCDKDNEKLCEVSWTELAEYQWDEQLNRKLIKDEFSVTYRGT